MSPLVSIIIINYNYGAYLAECLHYVESQTYDNIECLVVDNKSQDDSLQVIDAFIADQSARSSNKKFRCLALEDNLGLTRACRRGFEAAAGEYICFLDADDLLCPAFVESHIFAHMTSRRPVAASSVDMFQSTPYGIVSATNVSLSNYILSGKGRTTNFTRQLSVESYKTLLGENCRRFVSEAQLHYVDPATSWQWVWSPTSSLCFRRDAVLLMFRYEPDLVASVDAYLLRGAGSLMGSILIDEPLAIYRHHGKNIFSKRPALTNFRSFDVEQLQAEDRAVTECVVKCYTDNVEFLAASLIDKNLFIQAVETVFKSGIEPIRSSEADCVVRYIETHKDLLSQAFGAPTVKRWMYKYSSLSGKILIYLGRSKR